MTIQEFSNEFDTLLNSYSNIQEFGNTGKIELDEYEKSVFLTEAQEEVVISLYNGKNQFGDSFESTEELRRYLNPLVKTHLCIKAEGLAISEDSVFYELPEDLLFIIYESIDIEGENLGCMYGKNMDVIPVTHDDYLNIKSNPFRGANDRRALRIDAGDNKVEIITSKGASNYITRYLIRYLSKPSPIILEDLPDELTIDNISIKSECKLNPALHRLILLRAVRTAITSKAITGK